MSIIPLNNNNSLDGVFEIYSLEATTATTTKRPFETTMKIVPGAVAFQNVDLMIKVCEVTLELFSKSKVF